MLSKHTRPAQSSARALSVVSSNVLGRKPTQYQHQNQHQHQNHQLQQSRTILGLVPAIDKRLYRLAKGVMPPISKTEQIALGCGTIGTSNSAVQLYVIVNVQTREN